MAYLHMYQGNPTAAGTDGTQVSEAGAQTAPVSFTLNATSNQVGAALKAALRCDVNYQTTSGVNTTITPTGTTAAQWRLSLGNVTWGAYGAALTITSQIVATNTVFYVEAQATSDEAPVNDTSVSLQVQAQVEAV